MSERWLGLLYPARYASSDKEAAPAIRLSRQNLRRATGGSAQAHTNQDTGSTYDHAEWRQETSGSGGCEPSCGPPFEERTFLGFRVTKHLTAKGTLWSNQEFGDTCTAGQVMTIQRKKGARWVRVKTATTNASGAFSAALSDRTEAYRVRVPETQQGSPDEPVICGAATSGIARHSH